MVRETAMGRASSAFRRQPENPPQVGIEGVVALVPAVASGREPEGEEDGRRNIVANVSHGTGIRHTHGSGRGLLFVAQFAAQDLSDIGLRQAGPKLDLLWHLVVRQL